MFMLSALEIISWTAGSVLLFDLSMLPAIIIPPCGVKGKVKPSIYIKSFFINFIIDKNSLFERGCLEN
jgi:hypothetical protein